MGAKVGKSRFTAKFLSQNVCTLTNSTYLCDVQTYKRYDTAGSKGLPFLYPYIRYCYINDITAPCRGVEIPTELACKA